MSQAGAGDCGEASGAAVHLCGWGRRGGGGRGVLLGPDYPVYGSFLFKDSISNAKFIVANPAISVIVKS